MLKRLSLTAFLACAIGPAFAAPPPLPEGLEPSAETPAQQEASRPSPDGENAAGPGLPSLPAGLGGDETRTARTTAPAGPRRNGPFPPDAVGGFIETRAGVRLQEDPFEKRASIGETRLQLQGEWETGPAVFTLTGDFLLDPVEDDYAVDLETGRGAIDLREANVVLRPLDFMDLKAGRQILTWGVGDLLFINDLFPKDFRSFFIGRDDEYLKAPSDAVRASFFTPAVNIDVVYTPRFDADRFVDGSRLSYFNPLTGALAGRNAVIAPKACDDWFGDDEIAARASRNIGAFEAALYVYVGFWKNPQGATPGGAFFFPELSVYGASLRGPVAGGVGNVEVGYYDSREDRPGDNPLIPNSQHRYLVGYEREAAQDLTLAFQYYAEINADADALRAAQPPDAVPADRARHVLTVRLTKLALNQNLTVSLFNFWSPNQGDGYARARAGYKLSDDWLVEGGFNVFYGEDADFFGQFENNSNIFLAVRRSF